MVNGDDVDRVVTQLPVNVAARYTVSAATGRGVNDMFDDVAYRLVDVHRNSAAAADRTQAVTIVADSYCLHTCCHNS